MADPCLEVELLAEFVDGRISPPDRARIEAHAARCDACRELLSALARDGATPVERPGLADRQVVPTRVGRYVISHELGAGGMGVVYAARDPELDRVVAVKLLRGDGDASMRERLRREAQAMAQLAHPNVVAVHDVGTYDDRIFIAMEYVEGDTLARTPGGSRSRRELLEAYRAAGRGLAAAHAAGIVHRDFKPENVLVGKDGRVRVGDFGLARAAGAGELAVGVAWGSPVRADAGAAVDTPAHATAVLPDAPTTPAGLTATGAVVGTPFYMAPELHGGQPADERSDQFSFCVALFTALYGGRPFAGDTLEALGDSMRAGRVREPAGAHRVSRRIRAAIRRGLAVDPASRFPSMDALLGELSPASGRLARWAVAIGALVIAGLALITWRAVSSSAVPDRRCTGATTAFARTWNADRRAAIARAFVASHLPHAAFAIDQVTGTLDRYAVHWATAHTEACRATQILGEQTDSVLELRMICLARRQDEVRALVEVLADADAAVVSRSVTAVAGLADVAACGDVAALKQLAPPPADPVSRREIDGLAAQLADARATFQTGRLQAALDRARPLAARARTIGYRPFEAQAALLEGQIEDAMGDLSTAETTLRAAVWAAEAGRQDEVAARGWMELVFLVGYKKADYASAPDLAQRASAAIARLGGSPAIQASLEQGLGAIAADQGRLDEAVAHFEKAVELLERLHGSEHPNVAEALENLGEAVLSQGHADRAIELEQRGLAIRERALGTEHPTVARALLNLGNAHAGVGNLTLAEQEARRALAINEGALGAAHPDLAANLSDLATIVRRQGRGEEALVLDRRAVAIGEKAFGPNHPEFAQQLVRLGAGLGSLGHHAEALAQLRRAEAILTKVFGPDNVEVAKARIARAEDLMLQSKASEALPLLEAAIPILEQAQGTEQLLVEVVVRVAVAELKLQRPRLALVALARIAAKPTDWLPHEDRGALEFAQARAEWESGGNRRRAQELATSARADLASAGDAHRDETAEVDAWLALHAAPR